MNDGNNRIVFISFLEKHKLIFWMSSFVVVLLIFGIFFYTKCNRTEAIETFKYSIKDISIKQLKGCELYNIVLLKDGNFLISGGVSDTNDITTDRAYIYNLQKNMIIKEAKMNKARYFHSSSLLSNGNVLIVGGYNNEGRVYDIEIYDALKNTFQVVIDSKYALTQANIIETNNPEEILIFKNFANVWLLNIKQNTISKINTIENKIEGNRYVYPIKIRDNLFFFPCNFYDDNYVIYKLCLNNYKIEKIIINSSINLKKIRFSIRPINVNDNEILFFGIEEGIIPTNNIISYNVKTNNANIISHLLTPRSNCKTLFVDSNNIFIFGGSQGVFKDTKKVKTSEIYNIKRNEIVAYYDASFILSKQYEDVTLPNGRFLAKPYEFIKIQDYKFLVYSKNKIQLFEIIKK